MPLYCRTIETIIKYCYRDRARAAHTHICTIWFKGPNRERGIYGNNLIGRRFQLGTLLRFEREFLTVLFLYRTTVTQRHYNDYSIFYVSY